jgi:hypothetical protein
MNSVHYMGLDVHNKTISYCVKDASGQFCKKAKSEPRRELDAGWKILLNPGRCYGGHDLHRLDFRSSAAAPSAGEAGASPDAARHHRRQEEE